MRWLRYLIFFLLVLVMSFFLYKYLLRGPLIARELYRSVHYQSRLNAMRSAPSGGPEVFLIGNSIVAGYQKDSIGSFQVVNGGINGDMTKGMQHRVPIVKERQPEAVVVALGINDIFNLRTFNTLEFEQFVYEIGSMDTPPRLAIFSVAPVDVERGVFTEPEKVNRWIVQANEKLRIFCRERGVVFLDTYELLQSNGVLREELTDDGVHLTDRGYQQWEKPLVSWLEGGAAMP